MLVAIDNSDHSIIRVVLRSLDLELVSFCSAHQHAASVVTSASERKEIGYVENSCLILYLWFNLQLSFAHFDVDVLDPFSIEAAAVYLLSIDTTQLKFLTFYCVATTTHIFY